MTKGITYMLVATLAFAIMNYFAKQLSDLHPLQVVFFRAFGTFALIFPYMLYHGIPIIGKNPKWLIVRGIVGVISLAAFFTAIQRVPLGSAISIRYLGPIFGAAMAMIFLKEKITGLQWFSFFVAFSGVLVLKGFDIRIDNISLILLLISALFVGMVFTLVRYLGTREHHLTIINYFMIACLIGSLFFTSYWRMPVEAEWLPVACIGIFGLIGQVCMTKAFQTEKASVLGPFKYMELVFALIIGFIFLGETYDFLPFLGILIIVAGMVMNVYGKRMVSV